MHRRLAAVSIAVLGATLLLTLVPPARAQTDDGAGIRQAWTRTSLIPTFVAADGANYVAATATVEEARAFVSFTGDAPTAGTLTLRESADSTLPADAVVRACPLTTPLVGEGELTTQEAPDADCSVATLLTRRDDGTWELSLDDLVAHWTTHRADGIALVPDPESATLAFRLGFTTEETTLVMPAFLTEPADPSSEPRAAQTAPAAATPTPGPAAPAVPAPTRTIVPSPVVGDAAPNPQVAPSSPPATTAPTDPAGAPVDIRRNAATPPAVVVLPLVALIALVPALAFGRVRPSWASTRGADRGSAGSRGVLAVAAVALAVGPLMFSEATVFRLGLLLIFIVGAIGMHVLVNWAGELSLAHATMIGFPAFVVVKLSADHGISPLLLIPVGVIAGALAGGLIGLPAIRARGLQVALVTLAGGIAIERFFFAREWFVGPPAGAAVPTPTLGPLTFATARSLYPVLVVLVAVGCLAARALYRSKVGRGLLWIRADQTAAAAFGIPVAGYRALAYALAGAFAGHAGALTTVWVQRLTPQAFPMSRSFVYLMVAALAGRGGLGGVAVAAVAIEGGALFLGGFDGVLGYVGPLGLILALTRNPAGLNGLGRELRGRIATMRHTIASSTTRAGRAGFRPVAILGVLTVAVGLGAIGLAWFHTGNTSEVWIQNQELLSGGIGGLAMVVVGVGLLVHDGLAHSREETHERWDRLATALEASTLARVDLVHDAASVDGDLVHGDGATLGGELVPAHRTNGANSVVVT